MANNCSGCPHIKYCGLMISCAKLVKAGYCKIANSKTQQTNNK